MPTLGFEHHNHATCIARAVERADVRCRETGRQFTPVRRRVLEILLADHCALGAYDILDKLRDEGLGSQPPVAYRALDFLVENGFAHKIEKLNAFVACGHSGEDHSPAFLICRGCNAIAEDISGPKEIGIRNAAKVAGFRVEKAVVEIEGLCPDCQRSAP